MYEQLAHYYDALLKDEAATACWREFVKAHCDGNTLLEVACGSGELALALASYGYHLTAGDISEAMLEQARRKAGSDAVDWQRFDLRNLSSFGCYDGILCFCDSLNYLLDQAELISFFHQAYAHLHTGGTLLFDLHSLDRLEEFSEEYCESGHIDDCAFEWTILSDAPYLYQNFVFYDQYAHPTLEQHVQRVYDPNEVLHMLAQCGFHTTVYTDFTTMGIKAGEKYFFVCRK